MRIAVLDDDAPQAASMARALREAGYSCQEFHSPRVFLSQFHHDSFDLLILDWMMPELSGLEILHLVRESGGTQLPVIMSTSRSGDRDIVEGLNAGADDYVVKSDSTDVLLARVRAIFRRISQADTNANEPFAFGIYNFNPVYTSVTFGAQTVIMTNREFSLAKLFFSNPHRAFSRQYLIERLWGKSPDVQTRTLDTHVARIRSKLDLRPRNGVKLVTLYGYGYRMETIEAEEA